MGGSGSGRWRHYDKRSTVEESICIDATWWRRERILGARVAQSGTWRWTDETTGQQRATLQYDVTPRTAPIEWVRVRYALTSFSGETQRYDYKILLTTTHPNFGGVRYWFVCPLRLQEQLCRRRVGKLYLPPEGQYYGCRHCHNLTYRSAQESDKRVSQLVRDPLLLDIFVQSALKKRKGTCLGAHGSCCLPAKRMQSLNSGNHKTQSPKHGYA